jgi:hypothetical protein
MLEVQEHWLESRQRKEIFLFFVTTTLALVLALVPCQRPVQWLPGINGRSVNLTTRNYSLGKSEWSSTAAFPITFMVGMVKNVTKAHFRCDVVTHSCIAANKKCNLKRLQTALHSTIQGITESYAA